MAEAKPSIPLYTYFQSDQIGYLPDVLLVKLSRKLPQSDFTRLGVYLGVRLKDMGCLTCERTPEIQARDMLSTWYRQQPTPKWYNLRFAMSNCNREDLIQDTNDFMKLYDMFEHPEVPLEKWKVESYFLHLAAKIPTDWIYIALELGVTTETITNICQPTVYNGEMSNPVYEVLRAWKYNRTSLPNNLITVLRDKMGRLDIAMYAEGLMAICTNQKELTVPADGTLL